jgi:catechol 2,3-dioxygenase-like lactoylglutathione lyase family enzyme
VALSVTDLGRATRFYTELLGLRQVPRPNLSLPGAWLAADNALIHLAVVDQTPTRDPLSHFALTVATPDVRRLAALVPPAGGSVVRDVAVRDELGVPVTSTICRDPDGNLFELTDAGGRHVSRPESPAQEQP